MTLKVTFSLFTQSLNSLHDYLHVNRDETQEAVHSSLFLPLIHSQCTMTSIHVTFKHEVRNLVVVGEVKSRCGLWYERGGEKGGVGRRTEGPKPHKHRQLIVTFHWILTLCLHGG